MVAMIIIIIRKCHIDDSTNGRYYIFLGRDLFTALGLDIKVYDNVISGGEGPYEGCYAPMVDISNYNFNIITDKTVKPEESFINLYANECLKSDSAISATCRMRIILDVKYKKSDLNKVMTKKCQHLNNKERKILLILLRKFKDMFDGMLGTWNTTPVDL